MSATTSPQKEKAQWVKFDEADGGAEASRSSSGVSSARGSVLAAPLPQEEDGGVLQVSEVQVVDEHVLKNKTSETAADAHSSVFKQMSSSPTKVKGATMEDSADMDNVNLSDESPAKSDNGRGRRFRKSHQ